MIDLTHEQIDRINAAFAEDEYEFTNEESGEIEQTVAKFYLTSQLYRLVTHPLLEELLWLEKQKAGHKLIKHLEERQ